MDKLICEHCGAELTTEKKFCSECGVSNPHYVEPDVKIEDHLPTTIQELFDWYQMKFGYNNFVKVYFRTFKKEPNSYCIFQNMNTKVFYVYHYGALAEMDNRQTLYIGDNEESAVLSLYNELENVYDVMVKSNFKKQINYTEITNIPDKEHYDYGRIPIPDEYTSAAGKSTNYYALQKDKKWEKEIEEARARKKARMTPEDIKNEKLVTFITYAIIAIGAIFFLFFASFAGY